MRRSAAKLYLSAGGTVDASVCAVSEYDLVLNIPSHSNVPVSGQIVEVSICRRGSEVVTPQKCILHWAGVINETPVVAGFVFKSLGDAIRQWIPHNARNEIRFPVNLPAVVAVDSDHDVMGQVVDYSLSGLRLLTEEPVELDKELVTTVKVEHSSVELTLRPRWVLDTGAGHQIGCTMPAEQGILLAGRYHTQPTDLSTPLRPQTRNWNGTREEDDGARPFDFEFSGD
ncbi:MAG: PilZ domain-containing protein [Fuerstiella sp.]